MMKLKLKNTIKQDTIRHPFSKKKLRVLDVFSPKSMACPVCGLVAVDSISVVESDSKKDISYHVVSCSSCSQKHWFVFL